MCTLIGIRMSRNHSDDKSRMHGRRHSDDLRIRNACSSSYLPSGLHHSSQRAMATYIVIDFLLFNLGLLLFASDAI